MARIEDNTVFAAFKNENFTSSTFNDLVNQGVFNPVVTSTTGFDPTSAAQAFANVEQYDIPVANIIVNAQQQKDLRLWTHRNYDPVELVAA